MRLYMMLLSLVLLACSCSNPKIDDASAKLNQLENIPFKQLQTVRIMLGFISNKMDPTLLRQSIIEQFGKIGVVHTPEDTSSEQVLEAQKKPFGLLIIEAKPITTSDYEKDFPVISLSCRMYEEAKLELNKEQWMGTVWEKIRYIEIQPDQTATTEAINGEIGKLVQEFSDSYYKVNPKSVKPDFYIGKNVE